MRIKKVPFVLCSTDVSVGLEKIKNKIKYKTHYVWGSEFFRGRVNPGTRCVRPVCMR